MTIAGRAARPTDACPHGKTLGTCQEDWCRGRVQDLAERPARPLDAPETEHDARHPDALMASWQEHLAELRDVKIAVAGTAARPDRPSWATQAGSGTCGGCGQWWRGERTCHCATCHLTFTSIGGFDEHRHGPMSSRRCRSQSDIRARGYEPNENGHWRQPRPLDTIPGKEAVCL